MAEPLLTKDAVNIAGHKLPLPLVGAAAGLLGVLLILRARSSGSNVASAGTPSAPVASVGVLGQGQEAQLANLSQMLGDLSRGLNPPLPAATGPRVVVAGDTFASALPTLGLRAGPSSLSPEVGRVASGTILDITSATPITVGGQQWYVTPDNKYIWAADVQLLAN